MLQCYIKIERDLAKTNWYWETPEPNNMVSLCNAGRNLTGKLAFTVLPFCLPLGGLLSDTHTHSKQRYVPATLKVRCM